MTEVHLVYYFDIKSMRVVESTSTLEADGEWYYTWEEAKEAGIAMLLDKYQGALAAMEYYSVALGKLRLTNDPTETNDPSTKGTDSTL